MTGQPGRSGRKAHLPPTRNTTATLLLADYNTAEHLRVERGGTITEAMRDLFHVGATLRPVLVELTRLIAPDGPAARAAWEEARPRVMLQLLDLYAKITIGQFYREGAPDDLEALKHANELGLHVRRQAWAKLQAEWAPPAPHAPSAAVPAISLPQGPGPGAAAPALPPGAPATCDCDAPDYRKDGSCGVCGLHVDL